MPLTVEEKESITEGFKAAGDRMNTLETKLEDVETYKESAEKMAAMLNQYGKAFRAGALVGDVEYQGFWRNEGQAKEFGEIVMRIMGSKDMGSSTQPAGGALVPTEMASWMIQKLGKYGKFRKNALVVKLGSGTQYVPRVETDLTIYCPEQGGEITKSDMVFGLVGMHVKKFAALAVANRELEEDSLIGLAEIIGTSITRSMAKKEDLIGFMGDGTEAYFGMTGIIGALRGVDDTIGNIAGLTVGSGNAWSELALNDFENVVSALPEDADEDAKWFCSKKFFYSVMYRLARAAGAADLFAILTDKKEKYFMGYPVEFVSAMPSTEANSQICGLLGDLSIGAFLGERRELEIARSDEVLFGNDQVAIRGTERIDVTAYGVGDTSEAGPIVGLITAAS